MREVVFLHTPSSLQCFISVTYKYLVFRSQFVSFLETHYHQATSTNNAPVTETPSKPSPPFPTIFQFPSMPETPPTSAASSLAEEPLEPLNEIEPQLNSPSPVDTPNPPRFSFPLRATLVTALLALLLPLVPHSKSLLPLTTTPPVPLRTLSDLLHYVHPRPPGHFFPPGHWATAPPPNPAILHLLAELTLAESADDYVFRIRKTDLDALRAAAEANRAAAAPPPLDPFFWAGRMWRRWTRGCGRGRHGRPGYGPPCARRRRRRWWQRWLGSRWRPHHRHPPPHWMYFPFFMRGMGPPPFEHHLRRGRGRG